MASPSLMAAFIYMWLGQLEESRALFATLDRVVTELGYESSVPVVLGLWGGPDRRSAGPAAWILPDAALTKVLKRPHGSEAR